MFEEWQLFAAESLSLCGLIAFFFLVLLENVRESLCFGLKCGGRELQQGTTGRDSFGDPLLIGLDVEHSLVD